MGPYDVGRTVSMSLTVTDPSNKGALYDPTTVTCEVLPAGATTPTSCAVTRVSQGVYTAQVLTTNNPGPWSYRFDVTGPTDAVERTFQVNSTQFPGG